LPIVPARISKIDEGEIIGGNITKYISFETLK